MSIASSLRESLTFDEIVYLQAGRQNVLTHQFNMDPYNPPLMREIAVFPYIFTHQFYSSETFLLQNSLPGRIMMISIAILLLISVYIWAQKYFGKNEAIFALFLAVFEPNILANSHYITIDIGVTFFIFLSFVLLFRFLEKVDIKNTLLISLSIGLGMATKITFIPYFFCSAIIIFLFQFKFKILKMTQKNIKKIALGIFTVMLVIWSVYFLSWNIMIKQRADNTRVSAKLMHIAKIHHMEFLAKSLHFLETQPIPFGDYLALIKNNALRSTHLTSCFFLGNFYSSCKWYFMSINFILKTPLPLLIFFCTSIFIMIRKKEKIKLYVFIPIISIFVTVILLRLNPLIRYILPVYPFLIIFIATSLSFWLQTHIRKIVFGIFIIWYMLGTLFVFPHFISYANELTLGEKNFVFIDSNLDWGESLPDVSQYVSKNNFGMVKFSYFGRDNGNWYGLKSKSAYGSYKNNEICQFHEIQNVNGKGTVTLISATNWYNCGYNKNPMFVKNKIKSVIGESVFVF